MKHKKIISGVVAASLLASSPWTPALAESLKWNYVNAYEEKNGSLFNSENYDFMKFSEIGDKLAQIEKQSNRVKVEVKGQSSTGQPLYVVTIAAPDTQASSARFRL
ncbi:hypothetical protein [Mesobacillus boroniphilus]|uniref:Uncharacterized protein n=1 Tax=Mesobacillus boroniphilus JCM 21738 TaxID=1294265 RepID=W4RKW8_9BACI|nr:hypothetical protein [Mesobacillus boroniphilus]GAE45070.1 hypothetical protein JCM21738_1839 [Mesobacillus boroniphilus JCM 21738]